MLGPTNHDSVFVSGFPGKQDYVVCKTKHWKCTEPSHVAFFSNTGGHARAPVALYMLVNVDYKARIENDLLRWRKATSWQSQP